MRVTFILSSAIALAIGASSASAMDANEIFNRLKAQAGATTTVQGGGATRGLAVSYGEEETPAAAPQPSVVSVPAAQPASTGLAATATPSTVPAAPTPVYTVREDATPVTTVTRIEPSSTTTISVPTVATPSVSTYAATTPTYEAIQPPVVQEVAVRRSDWPARRALYRNPIGWCVARESLQDHRTHG